MDEYYIRTPEGDESRGPFNISKLQTLAEAGQVTENTLYYDETKEEWVPVGLDKELTAQLFPKSEGLKLSTGQGDMAEPPPGSTEDDEGEIHIEDMLKAAEGDTEENRHIKRSQESFEKAVSMSSMVLGIIMLLSAVSFIAPHLGVIQSTFSESAPAGLLNYPFLLVGVFDFFMAILLLLAVTDVYPLIRGRGMLGLGFGVYLGWALGDPLLAAAFGLGGAGMFLATIAQSLSTMLFAVGMGIGGNGALAFLAINGRFDKFYTVFQISLFG